MTNQPPSPPPNNGKYLGWLNAIKGLTISNVLVIAGLAIVMVPVYITYRLVSDEELLDRFLSSYTVTTTDTPCRLIKARQKGESYAWALANGFALEGRTRWTIGAVLDREPTPQEIESNCAILSALIDFMHGMGPSPGIVWQYEDIKGREGNKGGGR
jgi:hypothetical protein